MVLFSFQLLRNTIWEHLKCTQLDRKAPQDVALHEY